jgi:UDP-N-acetylmuramoyl-tripeptide--D-alanyl-D-alanine ligase
MKFTSKLNISIVADCKLYVPVSVDATNLKVLVNNKKGVFESFTYGKHSNNGIIINVKKDDEVLIYFDTPLTPSIIKADPKECLNNGERYCKWKEDGFVSEFSKKHSKLSDTEYIDEVSKYIKSNLGYKGFGTGTVSDRYEYTDEIVQEKLDVDCIGYHGLFVSLLRARNIPAVLGVGFRLGRSDDPHVWAWFYDKEWSSVDLLDDLVPIYGSNELFPRVLVSLGTTHNLKKVVGKDIVISYIQYCLTDTLLLNGEKSAFAIYDSFIKKEINFELLRKILKGLISYDDFLYILQQQDYLNIRYINTLKRFFFRRDIQKRDTLKVTGRVLFIKTVTNFLQIFTLYLSYLLLISTSGNFLLSAYWSLILIPVVLFLIPIFILCSNILSLPLYTYFKNSIIKRATKKISQMKNLKVVMISGSYGKTTIKNFIFQLISSSFRTQMTAGNINTHTGIATWILNSLDENTKILVCEVDGFHKGEIEGICKMLPADFVVITYLGDQHLERLNSKKILAQTLLETVTNSKKDAYITTSNETNSQLKEYGVDVSKYDRRLNIFKLSKKELNPQLSQSNNMNLEYAVKVANLLDIDNDLVEDAIKNIQQPDRRQKVLVLNGFTVIDDSYNISFNTAVEGLSRVKQLAFSQKKKVLVIFAGIAELGRENFNANKQYAQQLTEKADMVILLNSMFKDEVISEFKAREYTSFKVVSNMTDAIKLYQRLYRSEDYVILMHPELTDLYY